MRVRVLHLLDACEVEHIDGSRGAQREHHAAELGEEKRRARPTVEPVEPTRQVPPPPADGEEQQTRNPHVRRALERRGHQPRQPALRAGARHQAVMGREGGEEQRVDQQGTHEGGCRRVGRPAEHDPVEVQEVRERAHEDRARAPARRSRATRLRATPTTASRWIRTAGRSFVRCGSPSSGRTAGSRRSAT